MSDLKMIPLGAPKGMLPGLKLKTLVHKHKFLSLNVLAFLFLPLLSSMPGGTPEAGSFMRISYAVAQSI